MTKLRLYLDFHCPYCYIAWETLRQVSMARATDIELVGVGVNPPGNKDYHRRDLWSKERWESLSQVARKIGITINPPGPFPFSSQPLRALWYYRGRDRVEFVSAVFKARFQYGLDLGLEKSLQDFLQAEGVTPHPFLEALDDRSTIQKVEDTSLLWGSRRLRVIPTFESGPERLAGLIDKRGLENFLTLLVPA
jgi:2-hydroxychromene-2-carboxylate isomerase